jgi:hypothetical protein
VAEKLTDEALVRCADCRSSMQRIEESPHPTLKVRFLEFYQCSNVACGRRAVLQWEKPDGSLTNEDQSWVEREVASRGSWFPSDSF